MLLMCMVLLSVFNTGCMLYRDSRKPVYAQDADGKPVLMGIKQSVTAFPVLSKSALESLQAQTTETNQFMSYSKGLGVQNLATEVSEESVHAITEGVVAGVINSVNPGVP